MRADNSAHIITAARRRSAATRRRAAAALRRLDAAGRPVSFDAVAREAHVSRSWLYAQPDLRAEVERLRDQRRPRSQQRIPDRQRATEASLRSRLELATERARQLEADNRRLRDALAEALGERRRDTPRQRIPQVTRPCRTPAS
jgi:Family of unknown function (DUF6262)